MEICKCCEFLAKNHRSLMAHVRWNHKLTVKDYYDIYVKIDGEGLCPECGNETTFRGSHYLKYCSKKCHATASETRLAISIRATGKKQSQETIDKRIKNTDQKKKEATRQKTMIDKYDSLSTNDALTEEQLISKSNKLSAAGKGRKHTKEHHEKIIATKTKNGKLKHTAETKAKMSKTHLANYASDNPPNSMPKEGKSGYNHKTGYVNGIYFRSSYEERFLETCQQFNITVESAGTKEFRLKYFIGDKQHFYYPDFYLPDYDCVIEIKPCSMITVDEVFVKLEAGNMYNKAQNYMVFTEEELFDERFTWVQELEYLLS